MSNADKPYTRLCPLFLLALFLAASTIIFAQPKITTVSPVAGPLGTTITINGSGFDPVAANDVVYLGPVKAPILSASSTVLKVKIPTGTGYAPLTVVADGLTSFPFAPFVLDWPGGGVIDSGYSFNFADLGGPVLAAGGYQYTSNNMAVYDLDGDGYPDIVANYLPTYRITSPPDSTYGNGGFTVWQNQGVPDTLSLAPAYTYSYEVRILDMSGSTVLQEALSAGTIQANLDLSQLTTGIYLLTWSSAAGTRSKLILVIK